MKGYKRIRVFPERDLRATILEMAVLDCPTMQRLRRIQQLGQSSVAFPTAEHSRFSHSLGALYWAAKMLSYLSENYFSDDNKVHTDEADATLIATILGRTTLLGRDAVEVSWFEQFVRLAALTHDITHLPMGHTIEDQSSLVTRHDEDPARIVFVFDLLRDSLKSSPQLAGRSSHLAPLLDTLLGQCMLLYWIDYCLKNSRDPRQPLGDAEVAWQPIVNKLDDSFLPYLILAHDIVGNTICADLIDYVQRDTWMASMPWTLDKALLGHLKILSLPWPLTNHANPPLATLRLGVSVGRGKLRHDVITAVLGLLRARYDLTEKVYYHHAKCAADAMLEKAIRDGHVSLDYRRIVSLGLGDEGVFHFLEDALSSHPAALDILRQLIARRYFKAVFRIREKAGWNTSTTDAVKACSSPDGRSAAELKIAASCGLPPDSVIVSCLPEKMQLKEARALIEWIDGDVLPLCDLPEKKKYALEVTNLTQRYKDLWSLTVYLDTRRQHVIGVVSSRCEQYFSARNDPILDQYLQRKYEKHFEIKKLIRELGLEHERDVVDACNVASGGGAFAEERDIAEVVLDQLEQLARRKRAEEAKRKSKPDMKGDELGL